MSGFLDVKGIKPAALDTATAAKINEPGSATAKALAAAYAAKSDTPAGQDYGYLITTFTGNGVTDEKLSVFYSPDGKTIFGGGATQVYQDPNTGLSLRDPSTIKIGANWYTAYTVNNGYSKNFAVIKSPDLINWTQVALVSVSAIATLNQAWAPELIQDDNGDVYAFFSSMTSGSVGTTYRVKATTADLSTWSAPVAMAWTTAPTSIIDPTFVKSGSTWYCFYKNETTKYTERATSATLTGTFTTDRTGDWAGWGSGVEGAELVKLSTGSWRIYLDRYQAGTGYAWSESADLTAWTALTGISIAPGALGGSQTIRHGSFLKLTDQSSANTAMTAALNSRSCHAEFTGSSSITANAAAGPGTLAIDSAASVRQGNFISIPAPHQLQIMVSGHYSVNWVADHSGTASGAGAYIAIKGAGGNPIHATVDVPSASGAASIGFPAKYFAAGTVIQFYCQFGNALTMNSRVTVHKE